MILALAALPASPRADNAPGQETPAPLSWQDLARIALARNPDLASSRRAQEAAEARYRGTFNGYLPRLSLSQKYSQADRSLAASRWQAGADLSLDLFNRGRFYETQAAASGLDLSRVQRRLASVDLRFDLYSAYTGLLYAQEQIRVSRKIRDLREDNAQMVRLKYESGRESKGNSLRAGAELAQAEADLAQAQRDLRASQAELDRQLGRDEFDLQAVTGTLEVPSLPSLPDTASLTAGHPQVDLAKAGLSRARADLEGARSSFWPTLSAGYSRSFQGPDYFPDSPHWSAFGLLSWPLFAGGPTAAYFNLSAARKDLRRQEENLRSARDRVRSGLESAWSDLAAKTDQVRVQKQFLEAALQRNMESAVRYASGLMTFENWELVVSDLVNSEKGVLRAERDAALAGAAWEHSLGKPLEEP